MGPSQTLFLHLFLSKVHPCPTSLMYSVMATEKLKKYLLGYSYIQRHLWYKNFPPFPYNCKCWRQDPVIYCWTFLFFQFIINMAICIIISQVPTNWTSLESQKVILNTLQSPLTQTHNPVKFMWCPINWFTAKTLDSRMTGHIRSMFMAQTQFYCTLYFYANIMSHFECIGLQEKDRIKVW